VRVRAAADTARQLGECKQAGGTTAAPTQLNGLMSFTRADVDELVALAQRCASAALACVDDAAPAAPAKHDAPPARPSTSVAFGRRVLTPERSRAPAVSPGSSASVAPRSPPTAHADPRLLDAVGALAAFATRRAADSVRDAARQRAVLAQSEVARVTCEALVRGLRAVQVCACVRACVCAVLTWCTRAPAGGGGRERARACGD
jgi:hypothetical protein